MALDELIPDGELGNIDDAKKRLLNNRAHYPFRKWCAMQVYTSLGELWVHFDSPAKMRTYAKNNKIGVFNSISV